MPKSEISAALNEALAEDDEAGEEQESMPASITAADVLAEGGSASLREGFFYGLVGTAVREEGTGAGRKVLSVRYVAQKPGQKKAVLDLSDVEMPYPLTVDAALAAAEDYTYTKHRLVFENGQPLYQAVELPGIVGAVALAKDRTVVETIRGRAREGKYDEKSIRKVYANQFGFVAPSEDAPTVEIMSLLTDPNLSAEQKNLAIIEELKRLAQIGRVKLT
jgi:hypothetical protein